MILLCYVGLDKFNNPMKMKNKMEFCKTKLALCLH